MGSLKHLFGDTCVNMVIPFWGYDLRGSTRDPLTGIWEPVLHSVEGQPDLDISYTD